jgi:hypothetical protein
VSKQYEFIKAAQRSPEWHELRKNGIGASEVAAIAGVSPYVTPYTLWANKTGAFTPPPFASEAMERGILLEDSVAQWYEQETGFKVQKSHGIVRLKSDPWAMASLDRTIVGEEGLVEIKTSASPRWSLYPVPPEVEAQVQWQMMITGAPWVDVAALLGGLTFRVERVMADAEYQQQLYAKAALFWQAVLDRVPPATTGGDSEVFAKVNPQVSEDWVQADSALERVAALYDEAAAEEKAASDQLLDLAMQLKEAIGDKQGIIGRGWQASWKQNKPSRKTDWREVAHALNAPEEVVSAHTQENPGARVFKFRRNNDGE